MSRLLRNILVIGVVAAALAYGAYSYAPRYVAGKVPTMLQEHIGDFIVVERAELLREQPEIILHKMRIKNPPAFGPGDAIRIDRVNVTFHDYSYDPMKIAAITFHHVRGEYRVRDTANNFAALVQMLMEKKGETPKGVMARKALLKRVAIYRSSVQTEDASLLVPLADKELAPTGDMTSPVALQHVIADVLGALIIHEREGTVMFTVETIKQKTKSAVKSMSDAFMEYITTP